MAANKVELQEAILRAVDAVVTQRNNELKLDKTITGTIKKNIGKRGGKTLYQVEYSGGIIEAIVQNADDIYAPYTGVYVLVPQGNFSNEKIIIGRSTNILTDRSASVVAAAVNNYSIVGANLLKTSNDKEDIKTKQFGLRSFHPEFRDTEEDAGINHRAQFLYRFDRDENPIEFQHNKINIYKDEATAIMIKADFLTNLHTIQKNRSSARYGLIFNFAFDNLNKGYGETNGEILDNVSKIIDGKIEAENEQGYSKLNLYEDVVGSLGYFGSRILGIDDDDINLWTEDNSGVLDQTIELIKTLYQCFKVDNAKLDKEIITNTIQGFINLLTELKYKESILEIKNEYKNWRDTIVGDDAQKYIQFVLSSDDMIGNPFNFNTWNTQYAVFNIDLETFNHLDSILFYKEGFFVDTESTLYEYQWPINVKNGGEDIFVRNLQIYAMNPLDNQSGDYTLNVEPYNGFDAIISLENPKTCFKATLLRKLYENLTTNGKTNFFWFKEDPSVINNNSVNYDYLGGIGWRKLEHNEANYLFTTTVNDNYAYKNNYKCVVVYEPSSDDKTVLSFTFAVYNEDMKTDVRLESDLGVRFSFDAGAPTIKVLINEDRINNPENFEEKYYNEDDENPKYIYSWTIDDAANGYTLFLDEINTVLTEESNSIQDAYLLSSKQGLLKRIKAYIQDNLTTKISHATRIKYPVAISSSGFTITCYVKQLGGNRTYYDIGSASLEFENQNESIATGYRIYITNGDQVFQYDEYGNTPCSDKKKNPVEVKPLQAKLFTPSGLEVEGTNYQVEWILPIEATMITTPEVLTLNPSTGLQQSFIGSELNFSIAKLYDPSAYANQITCHIHFGETDYYKDTNFYFGKQGGNGTNGTDTIAKINCTLSDTTNVLHYQPLTLYLQKSENEPTKGMWNIGPRELKNELILAQTNYGTTGEKQTGILKLSVYQKETEISSENFKQGYPKWNLAGNISETTNNTGTIFTLTSNTDQQSLVWNGENTNTNRYRLQNIRASVQLKDDQMYYAFFSLPIIEYESGINLENLISSNRISIDKDFYLNEIVYNADGRNPIYNHNQGLRLYNIPANINKIKWIAKGGLVDGEEEPWISLLEEKDSDINDQFELETIPQDNASMIYILPKDIFDGSATNNRIEAQLYNNETLIATVYAPVNMTLNTFGLSSLNAWDGNTVTIDEEGGYVMAPQVGAGEKDDNNRFTGILMGKTETYTGGAVNEKQTGLFGYSHGLQSIFLDSNTGNATFGLPDGYILDKTSGTPIPRQVPDDYNEGRIELVPGGVSKIGGWRLGRRSLYYTKSGKIGPRYQKDYVPNIKTGIIEDISAEPYSGHHEKDIVYTDSGILLHSGDNPYISIKGRQLTEDDIDPADLNNYLRPDDSLEIQLDPKAPTLFTVFRHNGTDWQTSYLDANNQIQTRVLYPQGSRTYLAGINGKGEFVANTVSSIIQTNNVDSSSIYTTQFSVNSFRAFDDIKTENNLEIPEHTGLRIKIGAYTLGQIFISNTGLNPNINNNEHDSTLYITGGLANEGEYTRPISLHGKHIKLFAQDSEPQNNFFKTTNANLMLQTNSFETNVGQSTFKLFRDLDHDISSNLMSANNLKINAGIESNGEPIEYYSYYIDDSQIAKIKKSNVSDVYICWEDNEAISKKHYALYGSWVGNETYIENPDPNDVNLFIDINNYPRCYMITGLTNEYCTEEDFTNIFYYIKNRPNNVNVDQYIPEDFLKENRYTLKNNTYSLIENSATDFNTNQFLRVEKIIDDEMILDQSYLYVKKEDLNQNILYSTYNLEDTLYYVYRSDEFVYCRIGNNSPVLKTSINNIVPKIKVSDGEYYDTQDIDLDFIYYQYSDENNIFYVPSNIVINKYVKEIYDSIIPTKWDENGNVIQSETQFIENYRPYDEEIDSDQETLYFFYNRNYFSINNLNQNDEYVYIEKNKKYILKNNLQLDICIYNNKDYTYDSFMNMYNQNYYKVQTRDNKEFYLNENDYNNLIFNYWYCSSKIDGSNYILSSNVLTDNLYKYEEKLYVLDNATGIYYRTVILDPDKDNYEYISLDSSKNISINFNNKYYYNSLNTSNHWKTYNSNNKLRTNEFDKQSNPFFEYSENEPYYLYYLSNGQIQIKNFAQLTEFYAVQDIENNLSYIEKSYLDNYTENHQPLYLYIDGFKEIIQDESQENNKIVESISTKKYELYAGQYFGKITTNSQSNKYANLEINNTGINFFNSSGPINLISEDPIFNLKIKKNSNNIEEIKGEVSFGTNSAKFKNESMLGKFIIDNAENGLILTNTWLRLKSKANTLIESPSSVNIISEIQGNGNVYDGRTKSQIVLRAGSKGYITPGVTTTAKGSKAELILNSSNNGWATAIKGKSFTSRLSYPVFKVGTTYSSIGIYPEIFNSGGKSFYRENFYVAMPQYNSSGLKVDGHTPSAGSAYGLNVTKGGYFGGKITTNTGFWGNGKGISKTCDHKDGTISASGGSDGTKLGNSISISIPSISIKDGRPNFSTSSVSFNYQMPSATDVGADPAGSAAAAERAAKDYAYNLFTSLSNALSSKADKSHKHRIRAQTRDLHNKEGSVGSAVVYVGSTGEYMGWTESS